MYLSTRNEALYMRDMINRVELILFEKRANITNRNIQLSQVQKKNKIASWNFHRFPVLILLPNKLCFELD